MTQPPSAAALEAADEPAKQITEMILRMLSGSIEAIHKGKGQEIIALALDIFAAQAVAAERAKPAASDREAAREVYRTIDTFGWSITWTPPNPVPDDAWPLDIIARALAERGRVERERAAKIADYQAEYYRNIYVLEGFPEDLKRRDAAERIAAAIRNLGELNA